MNTDTKDLSIKGESIQSLYGSYLSKQFLVNRRYQRKLVWSLEEKKSFIDSIIKGYPVPLVLLAEVYTEKGKQLEIIDGMQRMNAIMSFIDQEFDIDGKYFDLDTMADTKLLKDQHVILQKEPLMNRGACANIVRYQIPLSVFQEAGTSHIDEVFRRLNSGGKHLSKQELRQAGALSKFAYIVRKLSSNIRGDSSPTDILDLNSMKNISITNKHLDYGISIDDIFWVKNNIISKEDLRQSKDEEVIADIVAWVTLEKGIRSSSEILNELYGYDVSSEFNSVAENLEVQIQKVNEERIIANVQFIFDKLIDVINGSGKTFNALLFDNQQPKIARYFQIVFLAFYKLIIDEELEINDKKSLIVLLDKAGDKIIRLAAGGGNWSAKEKQTQTDALSGVIRGTFVKSETSDPGRGQWITRFENILMQSSTEQTLYDFKVGLHSLMGDDKFNQELFSKIIKTLTAMANTLKKSTGYCLIGVADNKQTAEKYAEKYGIKYIPYSSFFITGINKEAEHYHGDVDKYFTKLTQLVKNEPISQRDKDNILRNISVVDYFDKTVIVFKIESGDEPSVYGSKYFVRHGSNVEEVLPENFSQLFKRFV
jgi:uncharacterized protein with ParB-like and HNH nuclease domain